MLDKSSPTSSPPITMEPLLLATVLSFLAIVVAVLRRRRYRSLDHIRGPPTPSWLHGMHPSLAPRDGALTPCRAGHDIELSRQSEAGELDFRWLKEYGATWRIGGHFGVRNTFPNVPMPSY